MSQEVSTNPRASESLTTSTSIQPWSPEVDADKLMDDLFSDIDRILEGGSKLPTEPIKPEYVSLQSIVMPKITMPPAVIPPQELVEEPTPEPVAPTPVEPLERPVAPTASPTANRSTWSVEQLLLVGGIASLVVTIALLLASQQKLTWPWLLNFSSSPSAAKAPLSASDNQFVSYMLRSLQVIDNKSKTNQKTTTASTTGTTSQPPVNLPSLPVPNNRSLGSNQAPPVLERIYIPVYPPQAPAAPPAAPATIPPAAKPSVKAPSPAVQKPPAQVQAPSPVARLSPPAAPLRAVPAAPLRAAPAAPPAAVPAPPPPPSAATPSSPVSSASAPTPKHTLVGLLELGDRSAALFEVNGITQRFNVGEAIAGSGWTLVSVANQEAVIRRNGEVRSVYVGQKF